MADFNLGRLKFKWRGDWAINTQYLIDDILASELSITLPVKSILCAPAYILFDDSIISLYFCIEIEVLKTN